MSLTQELDDNCENLGSKIILTHNAFDDDSNISSNNTSDTQKIFLRVGKPGKLFLQPNYTAFTKTNLGSIPSKIEKTLLKTEENIPITLTLNKNVQKDNSLKDAQIYKDPRSYTTSYSSKGYGVGFVSKSPRFGNDQIISPGPGEYSPDKILSLENNINKSNFGKSIFLEKTTKSLQLLNINDNKFFTSQEILNKLKNKYNQRYSKNLTNNSFADLDNKIFNKEDNKGNYFFESKVKKFNGGIFNVSNKNPGPGRYFLDTNFIIKNKNKRSPDFMEQTKKKESPIKTFGLNINDEKKIGFELKENKKNGKVLNFWNGAPTFGNSYDFGKTLQDKKKNKKIENNSSEKNFKNIPDYDVSIRLKRSGIMRFQPKQNYNYKDLNLSDDRYEYNFDYNKNKRNEMMVKDLLKFRKKDSFSLSPPRWDEGLYHDNASHFQIPGPAYYEPKVQSIRRSFNINKKDFIFTNSVPYKEKNYAI